MSTTHKAPSDTVLFRAGSYTDQEGKNRGRYEAIGSAWRDEDGQIVHVKLNAIPITWDGNLYFRARKTKEAA